MGAIGILFVAFGIAKGVAGSAGGGYALAAIHRSAVRCVIGCIYIFWIKLILGPIGALIAGGGVRLVGQAYLGSIENEVLAVWAGIAVNAASNNS